MTGERSSDGPCPPPPPRLALLIADPGLRSRTSAELILAGADLVVAVSLDDIDEAMVVVTDDPKVVPAATVDQPLSAYAFARGAAGGTVIERGLRIDGVRATAIMQAVRRIAS